MKVIMLITDLSAPGTGMQFAHLARLLKSEGCEVEAVSLMDKGEPGQWLEGHGIPASCLGISGVLSSWRLLKLAFMIIRSRPDILQTWNFHANIAGKALGFFCGARFVVSALRGPETPGRMELERVTSFLSSRILVNSGWLASRLKLLAFGTSRFETVGNFFDSSSIAFKERKPPRKGERWRLLFLGRRSFHSGIPALIHALKLLHDSGYDFEASLVGASEKSFDGELEGKIAEMNLSGRVSALPPVGHSKVPELLERFHLILLPNMFNWTPNTLNEAFASGLPAVASDIEGIGEMLKDGSEGLLAKPGDPVSICEKISRALYDYPAALQRARHANKLLKERCKPETVCKKYLDVYMGLFSGG